MKISGFSERGWGSRGVFIGHDLSQEQWGGAIDEALASFPTNPFLLQEFHRARVVMHPAWDEEKQATRAMQSRVRLCPYYFGAIKQPGSYHGYRYRILTAQGSQAAGGARDYIIDGRITGGFGLIMWPAQFGETGVMTFIVNQEGQVFEKNLGPDTAKKVARIHSFDPAASWRKVDNP